MSATTRIRGRIMRDLVRDVMNFHVRDLKEPKQQDRPGARDPQVRLRGQRARKRSTARCCATSSNASPRWATRCCITTISTRERPRSCCTVVADAQGARAAISLRRERVPRRDLAKYPRSGPRGAGAAFPTTSSWRATRSRISSTGTGFAPRLLCRGDIKLQRRLTPDCLARYSHCGLRAVRSMPTWIRTRPGVAEFKTETGDTLATDHRLTKAALRDLGRHWPGAVAYQDLVTHALAEIDPARSLDIAASRNVAAAMRGALLQGRVAGVHHAARRASGVRRIGERASRGELPCAQASRGRPGDHQSTPHRRPPRGELERQLLMRVDGTRDLDQLVADLQVSDRRKTAGDRRPADRSAKASRSTSRSLAELALLVR